MEFPTIGPVSALIQAASLLSFREQIVAADHGLDDLELQADIYDAHGRWIGRFDAVDHERKLILEYDGEQHRLERTQYLRDERRPRPLAPDLAHYFAESERG